MMSSRASVTFWLAPTTTMPGSTGVVQAVSSLGPKPTLGWPASSTTTWPVARSFWTRPTSTRHMRHMPTGFSFG